jgi:fluoride exporter
MTDILLIGMAGAVGAVSRYGMGVAVSRLWAGSLPLATLVVNVLGCFIIGFLMQAGGSAVFIHRNFRMAVMVGFLGAFTTFSAFGHETASLIEARLWLMAVGNVGANVILGIAATAAGIWIGRMVFVSAG